jgi:hypothetical protein
MSERTSQGALTRQLLDETKKQAVIPEGKTELLYLVATKHGDEVGATIGYAKLLPHGWELDASVRLAAREGASLVLMASH